MEGEAAKVADWLPGGAIECAAEVEEGACAGAVDLCCIFHVVHWHYAEAQRPPTFIFESFDCVKDHAVECAFRGVGQFAEDACGVAGAGALIENGVEEYEAECLGCTGCGEDARGSLRVFCQWSNQE